MLQNGDFSDQVATVQSKLSELGYFNLEASGLYGDFTAEAVSGFQTANGLEATGVVDSATYEKLFSDDAVSYTAPTEAVEEETVAEEPATEADAEEPATEEPAVEEPAAQEVANVVEPAQDNASDNNTVSNSTSSVSSLVTNSEYAASASKSVANANEVTEQALEKSANITPSANTAEVKRTANIWLWLVLVAVILGVVAFILLMHSRKHSKVGKKKRTSTKAQLTSRW